MLEDFYRPTADPGGESREEGLTMTRELIKTDRNGTKYFNTLVKCDRCGGDGIYKWGAIQTDSHGHCIGSTFAGTCFKCGGAGDVWEIVKEYTPEYRAKLDAANEKRKAKQREKMEAERAAWEATQAERRKQEAEERARREAERLAEIERNRGHFIGQTGDKIEMDVTLSRTFSYEVPCFGAPWKTDTVTGYVFKTDEGNTLVWKTTGSMRYKVEDPHGCFIEKGKTYRYLHPEEGERVKIRGTIKGHQEYNNVNQTELTRVKWIR